MTCCIRVFVVVPIDTSCFRFRIETCVMHVCTGALGESWPFSPIPFLPLRPLFLLKTYEVRIRGTVPRAMGKRKALLRCLEETGWTVRLSGRYWADQGLATRAPWECCLIKPQSHRYCWLAGSCPTIDPWTTLRQRLHSDSLHT